MFDKNRFRAQLALRGKYLKDVAKALGISESTLYGKLKRNGDFTREEINILIVYLGIDNPKDIFFAEKLT
jgi:DNA-binding CsgD family transcriptional regulator